MYSESDFEVFSKKVVFAARNHAQKIIEEAMDHAEKKVREAHTEAEKIEVESSETLKEELRSFEEEQKAKIESEISREWQYFLSELKAEVLEGVKKKIEERFEETAEIFLEWLKKRFFEGELQICKSIRHNGLEAFKVLDIPEKRIVFSKDNMIIEFSPESLMEEYSELIEEEIAKRIEA